MLSLILFIAWKSAWFIEREYIFYSDQINNSDLGKAIQTRTMLVSIYIYVGDYLEGLHF